MIKSKEEFTSRFMAARTVRTRLKLIREAIELGILHATPMRYVSGSLRLKPDAKKEYRDKGLYVYDLRDSNGRSYTIENFVLVNHIGYMICDAPIDFAVLGRSGDAYISDTEFSLLYNATEVRKEAEL